MSTLSPDGRTLIYCSETGPRLMRYDLEADRQLPDLQSFEPPFRGPPEMFFAMAFGADGQLHVLRGGRIDVVDEEGCTMRSIPLEGFGWATIEMLADGRHALVGSFFTGEVAKVELTSGAKVGSIQTGAAKSLAGIAEYRG
jgi:sugar lactone lactonase YvrE